MASCHCTRAVCGHLPGRGEEGERLGEDVVVEDTGVHREYAHKKDDVTTSERHFEDLWQWSEAKSETESRYSRNMPTSGSLLAAIFFSNKIIPAATVVTMTP